MAVTLEFSEWGEWILREDQGLPHGVSARDFQSLKGLENGTRDAAQALLWLNSPRARDLRLGPACDWLRSWGQVAIEDLARHRDNWPNLSSPNPWHSQARAFLDSIPAFPGSEYLAPGHLQDLASGIASIACDAIASDSASSASRVSGNSRSDSSAQTSAQDSWLEQIDPRWNLVGKIVLHLAAPPPPAAKPFAFLATWVQGVSPSGQPQHLPLARAIKLWLQSPSLRHLPDLLKSAANHSSWLARMLDSARLYQLENWDPDDASDFLRAIPDLRRAGLLVMTPDWWKNNRPARVVAEVTVGTAPAPGKTGVLGGMSGFDIRLALDGQPLSEKELSLIASSGQGLVLLRGQWVEIDMPRVNHLLAAWHRVASIYDSGFGMVQALRWALAGPGKTRANLPGAPDPDLDASPDAAADDNFTDDSAAWCEIIEGDYWKQARQAMANPSPIDSIPGLQATLRPYQLSGVEWMATMSAWGAGVCLADDMGLGKTLQVIALLLHWRHARDLAPAHSRPAASASASASASVPASVPASASAPQPGPWALVVTPASLMVNWARELARFAPRLRVHVAHAQAAALPSSVPFDQADVVITSYGMLERRPDILAFRWLACVLDEAQAIKTPQTRVHANACQISALYRVALSGTPVENRPLDLWALMRFLNPELLGSARDFERWSNALAASGDFSRLRHLVAPFLLRRLKNDPSVAPDLPPKVETVESCLPSRRQAVLYARLAADFRKVLEDTEGFEDDPAQKIRRQGAILTYLSQFKQLCDHPSLWNGDGRFDPAESGKFLRLAELAEEWIRTGERVLVFTQFKALCDPLARFLESLFGRPGLVLHGQTPVSRRQLLVEEFQKPAGPPFFVISVKAGGTGLTLTRARHVVHFDRWWNPATENQATDRAHRIGQTRTVFVHKLETRGTIEQRIGRMLEEKNSLARDILGNPASASASFASMSTAQLIDALGLASPPP